MYDDFLLSKMKSSVISIDGTEPCQTEVKPTSSEVPNGFFTFGYIAMKYLIVKAYKGARVVSVSFSML